MQNSNNLVWIDLEMTGLWPDSDRIIEIATIITDQQLNSLEEGPVFAINQPLSVLTQMDKWNTKTHTESGLVARVRSSKIDIQEAERQTLAFIGKYVGPNQSPLCGNSICQDRRFIAKYMPKLNAYLHYRHIDVSTIKELVKRWSPEKLPDFQQRSRHEALEDIRASIEELQHYQEHVFGRSWLKPERDEPFET
jgi:oligoribonuclease